MDIVLFKCRTLQQSMARSGLMTFWTSGAPRGSARGRWRRRSLRPPAWQAWICPPISWRWRSTGKGAAFSFLAVAKYWERCRSLLSGCGRQQRKVWPPLSSLHQQLALSTAGRPLLQHSSFSAHPLREAARAQCTHNMNGRAPCRQGICKAPLNTVSLHIYPLCRAGRRRQVQGCKAT